MPTTSEEWLQKSEEFYVKWNFPNCIGALDGKHINMRSPNNSGSLNFNYKHTFSIVLMALADANYKFIFIDVGCKGRISDGGVFNRSSLNHALQNNSLGIPPPRPLPGTNIETPFVILADDAFALKTYIMKPYNFRGQNRDENVFNYRLSRGRRMVESTFGILATRFRVFRTTIELSENNVKHCVLAACALHNWLMSINPTDDFIIRNFEPLSDGEHENEIESNDQIETNEAKEIRNRFKNYFMTAGEVSWQYDMV